MGKLLSHFSVPVLEQNIIHRHKSYAIRYVSCIFETDYISLGHKLLHRKSLSICLLCFSHIVFYPSFHFFLKKKSGSCIFLSCLPLYQWEINEICDSLHYLLDAHFHGHLPNSISQTSFVPHNIHFMYTTSRHTLSS